MAENKGFRWFGWGHGRWATLRAEKHGGRVRLFVEGQPILRDEDPRPLAEGYPGIWTRDNGVVIAYVALCPERIATKALR